MSEQPQHPDIVIYIGGQLFEVVAAPGTDPEDVLAAIIHDLNEEEEDS